MKKVTHIEKFMAQEIVRNIEELDIDDTFKSSLYTFFSSTMTFRSPIPSLVLVEGKTVLIHWIAGPVSIEIEADHNGSYYLWAKDADDVEYASDNYDNVVARTVILLREIEDRLEKNNPDWREKYLAAMQQVRSVV